MSAQEQPPDIADLILSEEEFGALDLRQQRTYLAALSRLLEWRPVLLEPKQQMAELIASECDELLFGGAAGGGKSAWLIYHQHRLAMEHKNHRGLHLRATYPEIQMSTLPDAVMFYASCPESDRPTWRASEKAWKYPNGSWIKYGHMEHDQDVMDYLSTAWDVITLDELTEFNGPPYELLITRARNTEEKARKGIRPHVAGASNPGGKGHGWVQGRFPLDAEGPYGPNGEPGGVEIVKREFWSPERRQTIPVEGHIRRIEVKMPDDTIEYKTVGFIRSTVLDNPHISKDYIRQLAASSEVRRRQYLDGDWTVFEGQFFDEFRRTKIVEGEELPVQWHVIEPFDIPEGWYRAHAVDHGFAHPFACLWGAWDPEGRLYIYQEVARAGLTPTQQAELVLPMMPEEPSTGLADPHNWSKLPYDKRGPTIAKQWADAGLKVSKAKVGAESQRRVDGWQKVREYLLPGPAVVDGQATKRPWLQIMTTCPELIRTLPIQVFDETNPEDMLKNDDDNLIDDLRYLCTHRPRKAKPDTNPAWLPNGPRDGTQGVVDRHLLNLTKKKKTRTNTGALL